MEETVWELGMLYKAHKAMDYIIDWRNLMEDLINDSILESISEKYEIAQSIVEELG